MPAILPGTSGRKRIGANRRETGLQNLSGRILTIERVYTFFFGRWEEPLALAWDADFQKCIEKENPDIIVSVHPLCQDAVARVCRRIANWKSGRKVPFVTCITDLGEGHPFWFHRDVDKCFVPGKAVFDDGIKNQLQKEQLALHGLPIREVVNPKP